MNLQQISQLGRLASIEKQGNEFLDHAKRYTGSAITPGQVGAAAASGAGQVRKGVVQVGRQVSQGMGWNLGRLKHFLYNKYRNKASMDKSAQLGRLAAMTKQGNAQMHALIGALGGGALGAGAGYFLSDEDKKKRGMLAGGLLGAGLGGFGGHLTGTISDQRGSLADATKAIEAAKDKAQLDETRFKQLDELWQDWNRDTAYYGTDDTEWHDFNRSGFKNLREGRKEFDHGPGGLPRNLAPEEPAGPLDFLGGN